MKYFFLGLIVLIFWGCKNQNDKNFDITIVKSDLPEIKSTIINGYNTYDSILFSNKQNAKFRNFISSELDKFDLYYDDIVGGFSIKHFTILENDFEFVLIRGTNGKFYYAGFTDTYFYKRELLKRGYSENGFTMCCDSCELFIFELEKSGEEQLLKDILCYDPFFHIGKENLRDEYYYSPKKNEIIKLIFNIYQTSQYSHNDVLKPIFDEVNDLESELASLNNNTSNNSKVKEIMNKYSKLTYYYLDKKVVFFKQKHKGLFLFDIKYLDGRFDIKKKFIPASKVIFR